MITIEDVVAALDWDGDQALQAVAFLEDLTRAIWDAYGGDMVHQLKFNFQAPQRGA